MLIIQLINIELLLDSPSKQTTICASFFDATLNGKHTGKYFQRQRKSKERTELERSGKTK